jgi:hypothetical protein
MATPQRSAVYSKGVTTEGGAERKASVSRYCPSAASTPRPRSHFQCVCSIGTQPGMEIAVANTVMRPTVQKTTLTVVSLRVNTRTVMALRA